jgi:hypothetical protein
MSSILEVPASKAPAFFFYKLAFAFLPFQVSDNIFERWHNRFMINSYE